MSAPLLLCDSVTKRFGGLTAVDEVSFALDAGAILGIIGPNGAGKTTLFNVVSGIYPPTSGRVMFGGRNIATAASYAIVAAGIARTFQTSRLFQDLSVLDNVIIGMHTRTRTGVFDAIFRPWAARRELNGAAKAAGDLLGALSGELYDQRFRPARELAQADRRRVEIARALASDPRVLLLDEPSSGMDDRETDALAEDLLKIRSQRGGFSIILIEHDMRLISAVTDSVIALNYGRKIAEGDFAAVRQVESVQEAYLGKTFRNAAA